MSYEGSIKIFSIRFDRRLHTATQGPGFAVCPSSSFLPLRSPSHHSSRPDCVLKKIDKRSAHGGPGLNRIDKRRRKAETGGCHLRDDLAPLASTLTTPESVV